MNSANWSLFLSIATPCVIVAAWALNWWHARKSHHEQADVQISNATVQMDVAKIDDRQSLSDDQRDLIKMQGSEIKDLKGDVAKLQRQVFELSHLTANILNDQRLLVGHLKMLVHDMDHPEKATVVKAEMEKMLNIADASNVSRTARLAETMTQGD